MTKDKDVITADGAIERYADMVYRLALIQMKNQSDADDVFQEVFVRLISHMNDLQSWEHVKAWLIRVTINCARKHFASYWNRNVSFMEEPERLSDESEGYMMKEEHPMRAAIDRLAPKYRLVVHLFYYEQLSVAEICKMTGQKETTVKSQLSRARKALKKMLEGDSDL